MKKVFLLTAAAFMFTGVTFAGNGDGKNKKKCAKGKSCCSKSKDTKDKKDCHDKKKKNTTAKL